MINKLKAIVGDAHVLRGTDMARYSHDFTQTYHWTPLAVVRPANTDEVSQIVTLANETGTPVVPVSGNTGLAGGARAEGAVMLSLERMNAIREIRPEARIAIVEAGVVLANLRSSAEEYGLMFPLTFGAQGSAMIGGNLATNAGGSNVLRYGNTRDLVLGIEVVLPTGEVMDLMSELHKDNSGYNLKHLLIGAEGTLGIITAAVLKLVPKPRAYATAMVAVPALDQALSLLNRLQQATGGAVEAFEYMPRAYIERHLEVIKGAREPFEAPPHEINILVEVGATAPPRDADPGPDGQPPIVNYFESVLSGMFETGDVIDAWWPRTKPSAVRCGRVARPPRRFRCRTNPFRTTISPCRLIRSIPFCPAPTRCCNKSTRARAHGGFASRRWQRALCGLAEKPRPSAPRAYHGSCRRDRARTWRQLFR